MHGVVAEVRILVTVSNIEIACHNNHTFQIDNVLMQKMQGGLIAVRIDINNKVGVIVRVEGQDIDVLIVDNVKAQSKSKF